MTENRLLDDLDPTFESAVAKLTRPWTDVLTPRETGLGADSPRGRAVETAWAHDEEGADTDLITDWCSPEDAEFIAHAREDVPTLIAEVRRLRALSSHPDEETVTTVEELDALPVGSLVLADGEVYQRITPNNRVNSGRETWRCLHEAEGYREWETYAALVVMTQEFRDGQGIARVLFRPTPEGSETL